MKKHFKIILSLAVILGVICAFTVSNAAILQSKDEVVKAEDVHKSVIETEGVIQERATSENISDSDIIALYESLTSEYSNEELANMLDQYSAELEEAGVSSQVIDAGKTLLRSTDSSQLKTVIEENVDVEAIKAKVENGESLEDAIEDVIEDSTINVPSVVIGMLLANKIVKTVACSGFVIFVYMLVVRWIIYKKAGKHGWAAIVPIYRDVVWLKVCGISPWLLLFVFIPIFGWIALGIVFLISKFMLPKKFGRSALWGLGIWLIPIIFESIVAFSKKFEYEKV